ncbi:hypothetical protein EW145_g5667 [Phellinidium pouzarii]|uniref:ER membrane protein complex subunit 1 n=1 Tax=Phellinidium pouzarii TaxID=167371 RepID=A0A4S4KZ65_9AGAM|nr:hypothetical protein EW145_g5667 [Phellinidium pouzarii]
MVSLSTFWTLLVLTLGLFPVTLALHASEAGIVDWHKPLVGVPVTHSHSLSPSFHRFSTGSSKSTQSVIVTATSSNVLAALDPVLGDIAWRYIFDPIDPIISFRASGEVIAALSGPGGATFRVFDIAKGDLLVERRLHTPSAGHLFEPNDLGSHIVFAEGNDTTISSNIDLFALTNGHVLRRLDAITGRVRWEWTAEDKAANVVYSRIARTPSTVFVVGLSKSVASYTLHITALSAASGEVLANTHVPSAIHNGLTDFLLLSDTSDDDSTPCVIWLEQGQLKFVPLTSELNGKPKTMKGATLKSILNIGLNEKGHFVALRSDGTGLAMRMDKDSMGLALIWEFAESASSDRYTESTYAGGLDKDNRPYVGRIYWSHVLRLASTHIFAEHAADGKGLVRGYTFPFETSSHGIIMHAALDAANPSDNVVIGRFVLTTGTGAVQLWQHDRMQWTREEALSEIALAEFVELPEKKSVSTHVSDHDKSFIERVNRQLSDAKDFPAYLVNFAKRFATGSYASVSTSAAAAPNSADALTRDDFGFRKLIIAATSRGVVYAINSGNGAVVWIRILALGWAGEVGGHHVPLKLFVTRTVSDGDSPRVVLVTQRIADNGLTDTVVFHIDALTGEDAERNSPSGMLKGTDAVRGEILDAFMLRGENKTVILLDKFLQIYLFPETDETRQSFQALAPKLHFPLIAPGSILGHQVLPEPAFTDKFTAYSTWTATFPPGETVLKVFKRPADEPVASLGKVLGDRRTLYKYLNPGLIGYITIAQRSDRRAPTCGVYLFDGLKGTIVYHATIPSARGGCDVHAVLTENWLLYTYYDEEIESVVQAKGYRVVSVELYEGSQVNDKTRSTESSVYYNKSAEISIYEQAYVFPFAVSALTTTSTKFGIATKDLLVANHRNQIQSFPRRMFDPRRPKRKVTAEEQEEWLIQYDPVIPDDTRRVISHNYHVANTRSILTSPALLESTSLVFANGLDLFASRVAPAHTFDVLNENFNKAQLVLTIVALSVAIFATRPIVGRKRLREQWY